MRDVLTAHLWDDQARSPLERGDERRVLAQVGHGVEGRGDIGCAHVRRDLLDSPLEPQHEIPRDFLADLGVGAQDKGDVLGVHVATKVRRTPTEGLHQQRSHALQLPHLPGHRVSAEDRLVVPLLQAIVLDRVDELVLDQLPEHLVPLENPCYILRVHLLGGVVRALHEVGEEPSARGAEAQAAEDGVGVDDRGDIVAAERRRELFRTVFESLADIVPRCRAHPREGVERVGNCGRAHAWSNRLHSVRECDH
mmetsp:Transcript_103739/g.300019  ORF Transcript_103739/g.300019 Transcript_103739/m.300019 type:complete len:252 (+) Transcript_103739:906-1661(+)